MTIALIALIALWATALVVVGLSGGSSSTDIDRAFSTGEQIIRTQAIDGRRVRESRAA